MDEETRVFGRRDAVRGARSSDGRFVDRVVRGRAFVRATRGRGRRHESSRWMDGCRECMARIRIHSRARRRSRRRRSRNSTSLERHRACVFASMFEDDVVRLARAVDAWNIDGSGDAVPRMESFIRDAECATGRRRGLCSYEGCGRDAMVGGHVHARGFGAVIAPICRECNSPRNLSRRQYGGSRLRAGIEVTRAEVTEGMLTAGRRYAPRSRRGDHRGGDVCRDCGVARVERGRDVCERCRRQRGLRPDATAAATRRSCRECGEDISNRPASHTVCLRCYRRGSFGSTSSPGRMLHTGYAVPGYAVPLRQETDTESESDSEWEII